MPKDHMPTNHTRTPPLPGPNLPGSRNWPKTPPLTIHHPTPSVTSPRPSTAPPRAIHSSRHVAGASPAPRPPRPRWRPATAPRARRSGRPARPAPAPHSAPRSCDGLGQWTDGLWHGYYDMVTMTWLLWHSLWLASSDSKLHFLWLTNMTIITS